MSERVRDSSNETYDLEALLDRGLATYTPANARDGLEDRVRARIAAEPVPVQGSDVRSWRWIWAGGIAVAAALLIFGVLHLVIHRAPVLPNTAHTAPVHPAVQQPVAPRPMLAVESTRAHVGRRLTSTKKPEALERGPSQEQLIAELMANNPGAIAVMARGQNPAGNDPDKPIEIRPLEDKPLEIEPIQIKPLDESPATTGGR
ncbi:MAG: hypothetical protein ABSF17_14125 [Terracidiphilus sp.]|jgi:hypothetical protein